MKSQDSQSQWSSGLGVSLSATLLASLTAGAAQANDGGTHLNVPTLESNTRNTVRAERHQQRIERQDVRIQSRLESNAAAVNSLQNSANSFATAGTISISNQRREARMNTAIIYPGQVSEFRTTRPGARSTYTNDAGNEKILRKGVSLDLSSTASKITVGRNLFDGSVTISVGGEQKTISAGDKVTAAEYAALTQKLSTGDQGLILSDKGAATGGALNLNSVNDDGKTIRASALVIPENVAVSGDFARNADGVRVTGDLSNAGSIYAVSSDASKTTAVIGARDISNLQSGLITTDVPGSVSAQYGTTNDGLNLSLHANRDFSNDGAITSSGDLELSAGRNFNNSGLAQANGNLNLNSSSITNSGTITSINQNVSISAPADTSINLNGTGGSINALNGDINIATVSNLNQKLDTTLIGGDWHSNNLNINSSDGHVLGNVGEVSGLVNISAGLGHFFADSNNLRLGKMEFSGDPLFAVTGSLDITAVSVTTGGAPLALIAGGNVVATSSTTIDTSGPTTGGNLTIFAGAEFTLNGSTITITGPKATGGTVDLTNVSSITTSGPSAAGNVFIGAWAGTDANTGSVLIPTAAINTGSVGTSGSITIIAPTEIQLNGGISSTSGTVSISGAIPALSTGAFVIDIAGNATGLPTAGALTGAPISLGTSSFLGQATIQTLGAVSLGTLNTGTGRVVIEGNGITTSTISTTEMLSPGAVSLLAHSNLTIQGNITAPGGLLGMASGSIVMDGIYSISSASSTKSGGNIALIAGVDFINNITSVTTNGPSATGGNLSLSSPSPLAQLTTETSADNSSGGDLTLVAYAGSGAGQVLVPTGLTIFTGSSGVNGTPGDITIVGGATTGNAITTGNISMASSTTSSGGILNVAVGNPTQTITINTNTVQPNGQFNAVAASDGNISMGNITMIAKSQTFIDAKNGSVTLGTISTGNSIGNGTGSAGDVEIFISGTGSLTTSTIVTNGAGATTGGDVFISLNGGAYSVGAISANAGTSGTGGDVEVRVVSNTQLLTNTISATSTNGGGGSIIVKNHGTGGIALVNGLYNANGSTDGGSIYVDAGSGDIEGISLSGLSLTVASGAGFQAGSVNLSASAIQIAGNFGIQTTGGTGGGVSLVTTTGNIAVDGAVLINSGGTVDIDTPNGTLRTNAASAVHTATINAFGNITTDGVNTNGLSGGQNGGAVQITSTSGSITTGAVNTSGNGTGTAGSITLSAGSNITTASLTAVGSNSSSVVLQTTNAGAISVPDVITATNLQVNITGGGSASLIANNQVNTISTTGAGDVFFDNGIALNIGTIQSDSFAASSPVSITFQNSFTSTGSVTVESPVVTFNTVTLDVQTFIAQNTTGGLTVNGGSSTITASEPPAGAPGFPSNPAAISFLTADGANLDLFGTLAFNGDVLLNNPDGTTTSHTNSQFIGANNVTLTTDTWVQQTNGNIVGNKFIFTGYTIANNQGDVNLLSNISFVGRSVAILSSGNINLGAFTINLSNPTGDSGNLVMLAGVDFDYPPPGTQIGQIQSQGLFDNITLNATGGNITGTGTITLTGGGSDGLGGGLTALANLGSISLTGAINTTSAGARGGDVFMIAPNGISTGNITTTGGLTGGDVNLQVANVEFIGTPGPIQVQAGIISGGIAFPGAIPQPNAVNVNGSILTNNGAIAIGTAGGIRIAGNVSAHSIFLNSSTIQAITFDTINNLSTSVDASGNGGSIEIITADIVNPTGTFTFNVNGTTGDAGSFVYETRADLTVATGGDITVSATGSGDGALIDIKTNGDLTIGTGGLNVAHTRGDGARLLLTAAADGTGTLTLNETSFLAEANAKGIPGDNFFGGEISLKTQLIDFTSSPTSPLQLSANGLGLGGGGTIEYVTEDATPTFFGIIKKTPKPPADFLRISATSGILGGDGGSITVRTGGNITVNDTSLIDAHTNSSTLAAGANYTLEAGNLDGKQGYLIIAGSLDASSVGGGIGGTITLISDNKKDFVLNNGKKAPKNGVQGTLSTEGSGGRITITNLGGGVEVATQQAVDTPALELNVNGKGTIKVGKNVVITADSLTLTSEEGSIGKKALNIDTTSLTLESGSSINLNNINTNLLTIARTIAGGNVSIVTAGSLSVFDTATNDGDLEFTANGASLTFTGNIHAVNGGIVASNLNVATGEVIITDNTRVETSGKKGDDIVISIGAPPKKGTNPTPPNTAPAGISVDPEGTRGRAYFGPNNGVVATGVATVEVVNKDVIFNNLSTGMNKIVLGSNSVVRADPPTATTSHASSTMPSVSLLSDVSSAVSQFSAKPDATAPSQPGLVPINQDDSLNLATLTNANALTVSSAAQPISLNLFSENGTAGASIGNGALTGATIGSESLNLVSFDRGTADSDTAAGVSTSDNLIVDAAMHHATDESVHRLENGKAIFAPKHDTIVETAQGSVTLAAGAVALVAKSNNGLAVYNLHDNHKNSVVININGRAISLPPGRHAHISTQERGVYADVNPIELIQHRALQQSQMENGLRVYTSEFAIPSACYAVKSLNQLMKSNDAASKRLAKQIMKTSSVIMTLCPDRGDYVQHFNPRVTASR